MFLSINDIFISASSNIADDKYDLSTYDNQDYSNNNNINQPQNQSLTRRVANAIFNEKQPFLKHFETNLNFSSKMSFQYVLKIPEID